MARLYDYCCKIANICERNRKQYCRPAIRRQIPTCVSVVMEPHNSLNARGNLPDLFLGEDMKTVYFKFSNGVKEKITPDNLKTCMDYIMFLKHGIVDSDNAERSA